MIRVVFAPKPVQVTLAGSVAGCAGASGCTGGSGVCVMKDMVEDEGTP